MPFHSFQTTTVHLRSLQHSQHSLSRLSTGKLDLAYRQQECTLVPQLKSISVFVLGNAVDVISTVTRSGVQSPARVANGVGCARNATNNTGGAAGHGAQGSIIWSDDGAIVTICCEGVSIDVPSRVNAYYGQLTPENVLSVGVEVNVQTDPSART